jgi:hypothetical protein
VHFFDDSPTSEMFSFVIYADIFYLLISAICWIFIDIIVVNINKDLYRSFARFFLGLMILNFFALFAGNKLPTVDLFTTGNKQFGMNLIINLVYLFSFSIASIFSFRRV